MKNPRQRGSVGKKILSFILAFSFVALFLGFFTYESREESVIAFEHLVKASRSRSPETDPKDEYVSTQRREGVRKELYYNDEAQRRLQIKIHGKSSNLVFRRHDDRSQIVEMLKGVKFYMQEALFYRTPDGREVSENLSLEYGPLVPMQTIRYVEADEASYNFHIENLEAVNAMVSRYCTVGHSLPEELDEEDLLMRGYADSISLECHGGLLDLKGNVVINHNLGGLSCRSALLTEISSRGLASRERRHLIELDGDVTISMREGTTITCASAILDEDNALVTFYSDDEREFVEYIEMNRTPLEGTPLVLRSREIQVLIDPAIKKKNSNKSSIKEITALGNVSVDYYGQVVATGGTAIYVNNTEEVSLDEKPNFSGILTLKPEESEDFCTICIKNAGEILSKGVSVDTIKQEIFFLNPHGTIKVDIESKDNPIEFLADTMVWDIKNDKIALMGDIDIFRNGEARLKTVGDVILTHEKAENKKILRYIHIIGKMDLQRYHRETDIAYTLSNDGNAIIDNKTRSIFLEKKQQSGNETQVHFKDPLGEAFSDKLILNFDQKTTTFDPTQITLEGSVKLKNSVGPSILQYMIADRIEYTPAKRSLNLIALGTGKVLYYDKVNNIQVSAPAVTVNRDKNSKQDEIRAAGDVRFRFVEHEIEQLKKRFLYDEKESKDDKRR